jgi:hypothetical protein
MAIIGNLIDLEEKKSFFVVYLFFIIVYFA